MYVGWYGVTKQVLAAAENHREQHQLVDIDEVVLHQTVDHVGTAVDQDVLPRLLLDVGDPLRPIFPQDLGVLPRCLAQAGRDDVLLRRVHALRELGVLVGSGPEGGPDQVSSAPQEKGVHLRELTGQKVLELLRLASERPGVLARIAVLLEAGRLHNAVERHELGDDQPSRHHGHCRSAG